MIFIDIHLFCFCSNYTPLQKPIDQIEKTPFQPPPTLENAGKCQPKFMELMYISNNKNGVDFVQLSPCEVDSGKGPAFVR